MKRIFKSLGLAGLLLASAVAVAGISPTDIFTTWAGGDAKAKTFELTIYNDTQHDLSVHTVPGNTTISPHIKRLPAKGQANTLVTEYGVGADYAQILVREPWITITIKGNTLRVNNCKANLCPFTSEVIDGKAWVRIGKSKR